MSNHTVVRDDRPYIEYIGDGLYRINGSDRFFYTTDYAGVDRGDKPSLRILEELGNLSFEDFQEEMKKNELEFQLKLQALKQKD